MMAKSVLELSSQIQNREFSVVDLTERYLQRIQDHNAVIQSIETISETRVRILANKADRMLRDQDKVGLLHGIPVLIDDLLDVANMRTSYGCKYYAEHIPEVDSIPVRRLKQAGAVIIGKTKTSEFGFVKEESSSHYTAKSILGSEYVSGGGSSGVCQSLAMNFAPAGVGVDVGGNCLLPSSFSGLFAFKPSHGRIPLTPIYAFGTMFADVAPVTKNVNDCAVLMDVMSGPSLADPISLAKPSSSFKAAAQSSVNSLRIGYYPSLWNAPVDDHHRKNLDLVARCLADLGGCVEHNRPPIRDSIEAWETIRAADLATQHWDSYCGQPDRFSPMVSQLIERGNSISAVDYINSQQQIYGLRAIMRQFFSKYDALVFAGVGCVPFRYQSKPSNRAELKAGASWKQYASTSLFGAISGCPTAHFPCTSTADGLPVGIFVTAAPGNDGQVIAICAALEKVFL